MAQKQITREFHITFEWWFAYLLISTLLSLSPGSRAINSPSTMDIVVQRLLSPDSRLGWGIGIHIVLVGIGLGTLFSHSFIDFEILKWASAAYLNLWLGILQWRTAVAINLHTLSQTLSRGTIA